MKMGEYAPGGRRGVFKSVIRLMEILSHAQQSKS